MSNDANGSGGPQFRTAYLIVSAAMVGAGTMIALAGLAVGAGHMMSSTRRWVNDMDVPVSQLARNKLSQARVAMSAGAQAWQQDRRGTRGWGRSFRAACGRVTLPFAPASSKAPALLRIRKVRFTL